MRPNGVEAGLERPSAHVRARPTGYVDPRYGCMVYRIEDADGRVLRRIAGARDAYEAIMRYWQIIGLPAVATSLGRQPGPQTGQAMPARRGKSMIQAPELPFVEAAPRTSKSLSRSGRGRGGKAKLAMPEQDDLFAVPITGVSTSHDRSPAAPHSAPSSESRPDRPEPATVAVQKVDPHALGASDRPDGFLYHVATAADAREALLLGLPVSRSDPVILTELHGVAYWLSAMAEDPDDLVEEASGIIVLRVRRLAVEGMLEADPDASSSAGCHCWLLTGSGPD